MHRPLLLLTLLALLGCGGHPPTPADRPEQRLLLIGWDGATFDLIDRLLDQGLLPNLARLRGEGCSAWLESTKVPISSAAWTGAATGHGPGETGIYDFFTSLPGSYDVRVIDARDNHRPPIWRILSGHGLGVIVFGVPITWPPEPVRGTLVAGMLAPPDATYAYPPATTDELRAAGFIPDVGIWKRQRYMDPQKVLAHLDIKERLLLELLESPEWDFSMVVFKSLDVVSHYLYDGRTDTSVATILQRLDGILGKLCTAAGENTNVLVVSDHGFGTYPFGFNLLSWLVEEGYAVLAEGDPTVVMEQGAPLAEYQAELHHRRFGKLDLSRTRVLASNTECEGNFGSLRLNLAGREPQGVVREAEAQALLEELESALLAYAPGGSPIVIRVWRGSELYPGPQTRVVPDLIFETVGDHQVVATTEPAILTRYDRPRAEHRLDGIFVAAGPGIARRGPRQRFQILDLAPMALHLLGQPVYAEMSGQPHPELLAHPRTPRRIPQDQDPTLRPLDQAWQPFTLSDEQRAAQRRLLDGLGYGEGEAEVGSDGE